MSDQVVVTREGGVEQAGTLDGIYERPAAPFVAIVHIGEVGLVSLQLKDPVLGPVGESEVQAPAPALRLIRNSGTPPRSSTKPLPVLARCGSQQT